MVNLVVFGVLGLIAIGIFIFLYYQGHHLRKEDNRDLGGYSVSFFGVVVRLAVIAYIIRLSVMVVTGLSANFVGPTIFTGGIALLPVVVLGVLSVVGKKRG